MVERLRTFLRIFPGRDDVCSFAGAYIVCKRILFYGSGYRLWNCVHKFQRKGIYTFKDGTDSLIRKMVEELRSNGAELRRQCTVEKLLTEEKDGKPHVRAFRLTEKFSVVQSYLMLI